MAKGLSEPPVNPLYALHNVVPKKNTNESTNNNSKPTTNTDNSTNNTTDIKNNTNNMTNTESNNSNSTNNITNVSTNRSTSTVIIKEKVKYTDKKIQRAYWLDSDLVKIFDKNFPAKKYDKSEIINQLLRNFLAENNLI